MPSRYSSSKTRFPKYSELVLLLVFLSVLGYLFATTAPEEVLQTVSMRAAPPVEGTSAGTSAEPAAAPDEAKPPAQPQPRARDDFGFARAAFEVTEGRVERDDTFADLLTEAGVPYAQVVALAEAARPTFDVRHLQAGKRYRLYRRTRADSSAAAHFVYQRGPVDYVSFALGDATPDSSAVREGARPITTVRRTATGTIERSLYEAISDADADPSLALALSKVYAWQIDFFRLRPGDGFRVIYEEERVGGEAVGIGRILGARFDHRDDAYYGLFFEKENEYFDEEGRSLRKSLLKAPLDFIRISSQYQRRRFHPVQRRWKAHKGTDYAAPTGTPVYSAGDGRVVEAGYTRGNGNWVKVRHNDTYTTGYLHFSRIADGIEPGVRVKQKQVIGYVGETGLATGPHLHYAFWKNGVLVDSRKQTLPSAPPVPDSLRAAYDRVKEHLLPRLRPPVPLRAAAAPSSDAPAEREDDPQTAPATTAAAAATTDRLPSPPVSERR